MFEKAMRYARRRLDTSSSVETGISAQTTPAALRRGGVNWNVWIFTTSIERAAVAGLRAQLFGGIT
jgi:hypothetical protein